MNSRPTTLYTLCLNEAYQTHTFLHKAYHSFPAFRNPRRHFNTTLEGHFKQQNHQQKCGKHGTKQTAKRTLVYSMRAEARRQSTASFDLSWERPCVGQVKSFTTLLIPVNNCKSATSIDLGLQINCSEEANSQIWNLRIMKINSITYSSRKPQINKIGPDL